MWFAVWTGNEMQAMFRSHVDAVAYAKRFANAYVAPIAPPDVLKVVRGQVMAVRGQVIIDV